MEINFVRRGVPKEGKPAILLLHGIGNSLAYWDSVAELLATDSEVFAVDLPGFGLTVRSEGISFRSMCAEIQDFIREETGPCVVVGHSLGAFVAMAASIDCSEVQRLALVSGPLFTAARIAIGQVALPSFPAVSYSLAAQILGSTLPAWAASLLSKVPKQVRGLALRPFVGSEGNIGQSELERLVRSHGNSRAVFEILRTIKSEDLDRSRNVNAPCSILRGTKDMLFPDQDIAEARSTLNISEVLELDGVGHWPHIESPRDTAVFIDRTARRSS
jgi:pimeloyl-ACP methyl ester carboxylesterase